MKYPKIKAAADAERRRQKLVSDILEIKDNTKSQTVLLAMDIESLEKLIPVPETKKTKKSDSTSDSN